jgi:N-acetylglucosaminyl-diphospho-decaprenol L-rhamnosyltransferase
VVLVDVVVVAYDSDAELRGCVAPLSVLDDVRVYVVDNGSPDPSLPSLAGLDVELVRLRENRGFAAGCNAGWPTGSAPYVLFLNPDARVDASALEALVAALAKDPSAGLVGPRIAGREGTELSQGRFPTLRRTFARVFFLHHVLPRASWTDIYVREERAYASVRSPDWVTGACMLVRRTALEQVGGFDERFFLYCEDVDLCRRLWEAGWAVRYVPAATALHERRSWDARAARLPQLAAARVVYARKHDTRVTAALQAVGVRAEALTRVVASRGGWPTRQGHLRSLVRPGRFPRA